MSHAFLSSPLEILEEARNGRMFILVDDEGRENEGALVVAAQMGTLDTINFMARYGRGLICIAMTRKRTDQLGLSPMARKNSTSLEAAFTVSIEARTGVATGISAADRARTISVAIDAANGPEITASPGHVFPLVARDGGVRKHAGRRRCGETRRPLICEIMKDDGTVARLDDLVTFAQFHKMKMGTIRNLIVYRRRQATLLNVSPVCPSSRTMAVNGRLPFIETA